MLNIIIKSVLDLDLKLIILKYELTGNDLMNNSKYSADF